MILTLYTEEFFNAAHQLKNYEGVCSQMHGHTWKVCVWVRGDEAKKDKNGILWDFNNLKFIIEKLDHKFLNDVLDMNPTVENILSYIYENLKNKSGELLFKIRIYENITKKESFCEAGDF